MDRERDIQEQIRLALTRRDDVVLWRNSTGVAQHGARVQRYGLAVGSSDLIGILKLPSGVGVFLALEIKTDRGRATPEQTLFLALVARMGGIAAIVRSVDEAIALIDRAVQP